VEKVNSDQLRLLRDFFAGKLLVKGAQTWKRVEGKARRTGNTARRKTPQTKE